MHSHTLLGNLDNVVLQPHTHLDFLVHFWLTFLYTVNRQLHSLSTTMVLKRGRVSFRGGGGGGGWEAFAPPSDLTLIKAEVIKTNLRE